MPRLLPVFEKEPDGRFLFNGLFEAIDERTGETVARGFLSADLITVGERVKTDVKFVTEVDE